MYKQTSPYPLLRKEGERNVPLLPLPLRRGEGRGEGFLYSLSESLLDSRVRGNDDIPVFAYAQGLPGCVR